MDASGAKEMKIAIQLFNLLILFSANFPVCFATGPDPEE